MASGVTHARATKRNIIILGVPTVLVGTALYLDQTWAWLGFSLGLVIGHLLTPDIDHHYYTHEEWRIRRWNKVLGLLWSAYWWPYEKLHSHRGISHTLFVGTIGRFLYLLWGPLLLSLDLWPFWLVVLAGWIVQDCTHLWLDC